MISLNTMPRTVINLADADKSWLDRQAKAEHVPMTELVRRAVRLYRIQQESRQKPDLTQALECTAGIWRAGDGLAYQAMLRDEWDERQ